MPGWFGPKSMGIGISPRSWQGWLATAIVLGGVVGLTFVHPEHFGLPIWTKLAAIALLLVAYLALALLTYRDDAD